MNSNRKTIIKFLVNGELDHVIQPKKGKSVKFRATKPKKIFKPLAEYIGSKNEEKK